MEQKHIKLRKKECILLANFFGKAIYLSNVCYNISQNITGSEKAIDAHTLKQIKKLTDEFDEFKSKSMKSRCKISKFADL